MAENSKNMTPEQAKAKFVEIYKQYIKRPGSETLLQWLEQHDFFTAPASSKYHSNVEGGLCMHSLNVFWRLVEDTEMEALKKGTDTLSDKVMESLAITGLLHDLCKVDFYKKSCKAKKVYSENGSRHDAMGHFDWADEFFYSIDEQLYFGHGEKSVFIIMNFMPLNVPEALAIRYHMGDFVNDKETSACYNAYNLATMLHIADLKATFLDERDPSAGMYNFRLTKQ